MECTRIVQVSGHLERLDFQLGFSFLRITGITRCLIRVPSPGLGSVGTAIECVVVVTKSFSRNTHWKSAIRRASRSIWCPTSYKRNKMSKQMRVNVTSLR